MHKFHEINSFTPYHFDWKAPLFSDAKYTVKRVRVRFTAPGYGMGVECAWRGAFKIGNVCPVK